jgi:hypothetical protein
MGYISIGSTPSDEPCAQVGTDNYFEQAKKECHAYMGQIMRIFPEFPDYCWLSVKGFPHDFGTYYEVIVRYDENDEKATEFAYNIESNSPANWDDEAKKELEIKEANP